MNEDQFFTPVNKTYYEFCDDLDAEQIVIMFPEGLVKYGDDIEDWCKQSSYRGYSSTSRMIFINDPNDRLLFMLKFPQQCL